MAMAAPVLPFTYKAGRRVGDRDSHVLSFKQNAANIQTKMSQKSPADFLFMSHESEL